MTDRTLVVEFAIDGAPVPDLVVLEVSAREALSTCPRATLRARAAAPADDAWIGARAALRLAFGDEHPRYFHGVVFDAASVPQPDGAWVLTVEIGARFELLTLGRDCRIFQNKSVPQIVDAVLADVGLAPDAGHAWRTRTTYRPRPYVAQYNESDYAFVARLLADEGIGFAVWNHEADAEVVFFDATNALEPIPGDATLADRGDTASDVDAVDALRDVRRARSDAAMLRDYDLRRPSVDLSARERAPGSADREVYAHRGGFADEATGRRLALRALERLRLGAHAVTGRAFTPRLEPGRFVTVERSARAAYNAEYLLLEVRHHVQLTRATGRAYTCEFVAVPRATAFRPQAAPAPSAPGAQVAFVTTPAGEEIHADDFGRVKVRFPWDRAGVTDDQSSTWLRVGQLPMPGPMMLPRKDFEVLVAFELGDLDRPFVAGHLYNGEARPPYALPGGATRSSLQTATTAGGPGANELRFEDAGGGEEIYLNASHDLTVAVANDARWNVTNNEACRVGANHTLKVGAACFAQVTGNRTLSVGANQTVNVGGDYSDGTGGTCTVTVGGLRKVQVGADHSENVTGTLTRTVATLQCVTGIAGYARQVAGDATTRVDGAWAEVCGRSRSSSVTGRRTENVGALKMVRAKSINVSASGALLTQCAAMSVRAGGARVDSAEGALAVSSAGGLSVNAESITIEAQNRLVFTAGGTLIRMSSSGAVSIRAPRIDLRGVKALNQIMHKSN